MGRTSTWTPSRLARLLARKCAHLSNVGYNPHQAQNISMNLRNLSVGLLSFSLCLAAANAQSSPCLDAAEESHHRVVLETAQMRVLLLELPRIASTEPYCYASSYVYIVLAEGTSSTTAEGRGTFSRDWYGSETHIVYNPQKQVVRNESGGTFREVIVELRRGAEYDPVQDNFATNMFPLSPGSLKSTWTVSFVRSGIQFFSTQLGAGDSLKVSGAGHLLIALNDLTLQPRQRGATAGEAIELQSQEVTNLNSGLASDLVNTGHRTARFILIEY
jgi:hypothetical protein